MFFLSLYVAIGVNSLVKLSNIVQRSCCDEVHAFNIKSLIWGEDAIVVTHLFFTDLVSSNRTVQNQECQSKLIF